MPWGGRAQRKAAQGHALSVGGQAHQAKQPAGRQGPTMPVSAANTAASAGTPPICAATPIATGAVTDLGPGTSAHPRQAQCPAQPHGAGCRRGALPERPAPAAPACARPGAATAASLAHDGGPSKKWMNCAPAKWWGTPCRWPATPRQHRHREHHRVGPWACPARSDTACASTYTASVAVNPNRGADDR